MPHNPHPRLITKEQFSEGTTIDGSRLDRAAQDVLERVNEVPQGDISRRFTQTQFVMGWTPQDPNVTLLHRFPWLRTFNESSEVVGTLPDEYPTNAFRVKGSRVPGIDLLTSVGEQFTWECSWFIDRPAILKSIVVFLVVDHTAAPLATFDNTFTYGPAGIPPGFANGEPTEDLSINLAIDSEFDRENRRLANNEISKHRFRINRDAVSFGALPVNPAVDMTPGPHPGGSLQGAYIPLRGDNPFTGLNIPIRQHSRLRFQVTIPLYSGNNSSWAAIPWYKQQMNSTITLLEPLR